MMKYINYSFAVLLILLCLPGFLIGALTRIIYRSMRAGWQRVDDLDQWFDRL